MPASIRRVDGPRKFAQSSLSYIGFVFITRQRPRPPLSMPILPHHTPSSGQPKPTLIPCHSGWDIPYYSLVFPSVPSFSLLFPSVPSFSLLFPHVPLVSLLCFSLPSSSHLFPCFSSLPFPSLHSFSILFYKYCQCWLPCYTAIAVFIQVLKTSLIYTVLGLG